MGTIRAVFFDVAHTLLEKPSVLPRMRQVLAQHGVDVPLRELQLRHTLLMEAIVFPDRTDSDFYRGFNAAVVRAVGAIPTPGLLDDIFAASTYQPWVPFADLAAIRHLPFPCGILSNWDATLEQTLDGLLDVDFDWILGSSEQGVRKPDAAFFKLMSERTGFEPGEIAFVGDSMRLDIEPATKQGYHAILIDRLSVFPHSPLPRIPSLDQLGAML